MFTGDVHPVTLGLIRMKLEVQLDLTPCWRVLGRKASAPTWSRTFSMSVVTVAMVSREQGVLAAGRSVTLSRRMAQSVCRPPHMALEPRPPAELRRGSRRGSRCGPTRRQMFLLLQNPAINQISMEMTRFQRSQLFSVPLQQLFQTSTLVFRLPLL